MALYESQISMIYFSVSPKVNITKKYKKRKKVTTFRSMLYDSLSD